MNTPSSSSQIMHPGHYLKLEMHSRQETIESLSDALNITVEHLQNIFEGTEPFTPELALQLEKHWNSTGFILLEHQKDLDQGQG